MSAVADRRTAPTGARGRAFRGLALVFVLSFVNLTGLIVTMTAVGGTAPWSRWQFIGAFGVTEMASGIANVISPNLWRLPIAQLETSERTDVKLAGSAVLLPHWGGLARCLAGAVCAGGAAWEYGLGPASLGLIPLVPTLAFAIVAISAALARAGVARPDIDVVQFVVRRGMEERELPPLSLGASVFQFVLSVLTVPAAKGLPPSILYRPELAPSPAAIAVTLVAAALLGALVWVLWRDRIGGAAPAEQQREAEQHA